MPLESMNVTAEVSHRPRRWRSLRSKCSLLQAVTVVVVDLASQDNNPDVANSLVADRQTGLCCFMGVGHNFLDRARWADRW